MTTPCELCEQYEDPPDGYEDSIRCPVCDRLIPFVEETHYVGDKLPVPEPAEVFEEGTVVRIDHAGHVWDSEIALICGIKHKFYRLELLGRKTWIPQTWVKRYEP